MRLLKRLLVGLLFFFALLAAGYWFRAPLLRGVADAWIIHQPLSRADVIVVLGGGMETRPFEAARLYQLGLAPKILLPTPRIIPSAQAGLIPTDLEIARLILVKNKVSDTAIIVISGTVNNTHDEAIAVRQWAATNAVKRVIVVTDFFHTRRALWMFHKELAPAGIQVEADAAPGKIFSPTDWWQHAEGVVTFQNELLKYAYYRVKY